MENFDKVLIDQNLNLQLLHFKSISSCLKSFKEFVNHLNCLKIKDDTGVVFCESDSIKSVGYSLKVSDLKYYLQDKFKRDYEENEDGKYQFIENLFEDCCYDLINQLLSENIILPIKGKYDVKFYLDQFYNFIKEAIDDLLNDLDNNYYSFDVPYILWDYTWKVRKQTIKMYESIISNAWETLKVCEYFSDLIGRKITTVYDFIEVDKIICDFINMMRCVKENEKYEVSPINPMITDNFKIQFINGIEIVFENSFEPGEIKAYNSEREDIKIIKNVDYFENKRNNGFCLPYEKILEKNIYEIEVISKSGDLNQSFKVKDNLKLDNHKSLIN